MYDLSLLVATMVWVGVWIVYLRHPASSVFHPLTYYLGVHGIVFVLRPILFQVFDYERGLYLLYGFWPTLETRLIVIYGATLGLICFSAVCLHFTSREPIFANRPVIGDSIRRRIVPTYLAVCLLCLPVAGMSLYQKLHTRTIGVSSMDMVNGISINTDTNGYFAVAMMMIGPLTCLLAWLFRFRLIALVPFALFALSQAATGGRFPVVVATVTLAILYYFDQGRRWPRVTSVLGLALIFFCFDLIGSDRGAGLRALFFGGAKGNYSYLSRKPFEGMDYASMEFFEYIVNAIPNKTGTYGYFLDNLQVFTEPIPRMLWSGKPIGAPIQLYNLWDYGYPIGMTLSLPGEGWAQLGWLGIVIWCGLWGGIYAWIYNLFAKSRMSAFAIALYAVFLPMVIMFIRDGTLVALMRYSLFLFVPILVWKLADGVVSGKLTAPGRKLPGAVANTRKQVKRHQPIPPHIRRKLAAEGKRI